MPENVRDMLIHGTDGMEVKVHYKGQRGRRRLSDVAFEGLIKNSERRYRETGSDTMKQEYEILHADYPVSVPAMDSV